MLKTVGNPDVRYGTQTIQDGDLKFGTSGDGIIDANNNELLMFQAIASAVNEVTLKNAATGNSPTFEATGDDANVGINFNPKGSGLLNLNGGITYATSLGFNSATFAWNDNNANDTQNIRRSMAFVRVATAGTSFSTYSIVITTGGASGGTYAAYLYNPLSGTFSSGSVSFTPRGAANTYTLSYVASTGAIRIQRTAGTDAYEITIYRFLTN